jgi:hypothetical protein
MKKVVFLLSVVLLTPCSALAQELSAADLDRRLVALRDLLEEQWEYTLRTSPEFASILGDRRYNDQVPPSRTTTTTSSASASSRPCSTRRS